MHDLPDDQRAASALCAFGDHLYPQAARVLRLPAFAAADLLREALTTLCATPGAGQA